MNPICLTAIRIVSACIVSTLLSCEMAGAAVDELARAIREDKQLCSTPDGLMYEVKFLAAISPALFGALDACAGSKTYNFEMAFIISSDGRIKRTVYTRNQPIAACVAAKLNGVSGPRPPRDPCTIVGHYSSKPK